MKSTKFLRIAKVVNLNPAEGGTLRIEYQSPLTDNHLLYTIHYSLFTNIWSIYET